MYFEELQDERLAKIMQQAGYREEEIHKRLNKQAERVRRPLKVSDVVLYRDLKVRRSKNMHSPAYAGPARIKEIHGAIAVLEPLATGVHYNLRPRQRENVATFRMHLSHLRPYAGDPQRDHRLASDILVEELGALDMDDHPKEFVILSADEALGLYNLLEEVDLEKIETSRDQ